MEKLAENHPDYAFRSFLAYRMVVFGARDTSSLIQSNLNMAAFCKFIVSDFNNSSDYITLHKQLGIVKKNIIAALDRYLILFPDQTLQQRLIAIKDKVASIKNAQGIMDAIYEVLDIVKPVKTK